MRLFYAPYGSPLGAKAGKLFAAASYAGITDMAFVENEAVFARLLFSRHKVKAELEDGDTFKELFSFLDRYFAGESVAFKLSTDLSGPLFSQRVWNELKEIPYGEVRTYAEVAASVGSPDGARAIGNICGKNPLPVAIPCHRVVATGGGLGGYSAAYAGLSGKEIKKVLLAKEGVTL